MFCQKFLDAGIQDVSTSISIVHDLTEKHQFSKGVMMMVMKVTNTYNTYKHEIVEPVLIFCRIDNAFLENIS